MLTGLPLLKHGLASIMLRARRTGSSSLSAAPTASCRASFRNANQWPDGAPHFCWLAGLIAS
jgi:hypothetical protein